MAWGDEFDKLDSRIRSRVVLTHGYAMAAALCAAADAAASVAHITREMKHPRYDNVAPSSPKPRIRKGR